MLKQEALSEGTTGEKVKQSSSGSVYVCVCVCGRVH